MTEERYEQLKATTKQPTSYNHRGWLVINGNLMTELTVDAHVFVSGNIYAPLRSTGRIVCDGKVEAGGSILEYFSPNMIEFSTKYLENFDLLITNGMLEFSDSITKNERTRSLFTQGNVMHHGLETGAVVLNKDLTIITDDYCALNACCDGSIFEVNENVKLIASSIRDNGAGICTSFQGIFVIYHGATVEASGQEHGFINHFDSLFISKGNLITYGKTGIHNEGTMFNYNNTRATGVEYGVINKDNGKFVIGNRATVDAIGSVLGFNNITVGYSETYVNSKGDVKDYPRRGVLIVEEGGTLNCIGGFYNRLFRNFLDGSTNVNGTISITGVGVDKKDMFTTTTTKGKGKVYINDVIVYNSKFPIEDVNEWVN